MAQETGRTRFHYGFYAAMKVEYDIIHANITYEQEIQLGEDPVRLDFLIIKKAPDVVLTDPIGEFFKSVNIFEYKSPEDGLSIDDFYKAAGYAFIYKGYDRKVDELPIENMTLTLVRHAYPRELIKALKQSGFIVIEKYPGMYRIEGIKLNIQLVVSSRLPEGDYGGLKLLVKGCKKDDVINYAVKAMASNDENVKVNAGTVIGICLDVNDKLGNELNNLKEEAIMTGAEVIDLVENVYKKFLDTAKSRGIPEDTAKGIAEGAVKGLAKGFAKGNAKSLAESFAEGNAKGISQEKERVATDMLRDGEPIEKVAKYSRLAEETIRNLAKSLGVAVM